MKASQKRAMLGCSAMLAALTTSCSSSTPPPVAAPRSHSPSAPMTSSGTPSKPHARATKPPQASATSPQASPPATEFRPPGDIPDSQVYVDFAVPGSRVHIKVPEGWSRSSAGGTTTFSDHYNSIAVKVVPQAQPPTVATAARVDVPQLRKTVTSFAHGSISRIQRQRGSAVLLTYSLDSAPSAVTGKVVRDAAQRYEFWHAGQEAVLTLTGPTNADNVDPWRLVSDSLRWG